MELVHLLFRLRFKICLNYFKGRDLVSVIKIWGRFSINGGSDKSFVSSSLK